MIVFVVIIFSAFYGTEGKAQYRYFKSLRAPQGIKTIPGFTKGSACLDVCDSSTLYVQTTTPISIAKFYSLVDEMFYPGYVNYSDKGSFSVDSTATLVSDLPGLENLRLTCENDRYDFGNTPPINCSDMHYSYGVSASWFYKPSKKHVRGCNTLVGEMSNELYSATEAVPKQLNLQASFKCKI